ncbi:hypothetical protein GGI07_005099 [Coemansia sp. Benny D115]|nr:hypothetical protein GGI07_005099 [Coemansia sp. Benny D115]
MALYGAQNRMAASASKRGSSKENVVNKRMRQEASSHARSSEPSGRASSPRRRVVSSSSDSDNGSHPLPRARHMRQVSEAEDSSRRLAPSRNSTRYDDDDGGRSSTDGGESDEIEGIVERMLATSASARGSAAQLKMLWGIYDRNRKLHSKYSRLAEKAADEMHRATKNIYRIVSSQYASADPPSEKAQKAEFDSVLESAAPVAPQHPSKHPTAKGGGDIRSQLNSGPRANTRIDSMSPPPPPLPLPPSSDMLSTHGRLSRSEIGSGSDHAIDSVMESGRIQPRRLRAATPTTDTHSLSALPAHDSPVLGGTAAKMQKLVGQISADDQADQPASLIGTSSSAERPFQYMTTLRTAFKLKPREAFVCSFEGMSQQSVVSYGMEPTVKFWNPDGQYVNLQLREMQLGMDYVEQMVQLSPSLLALLSGASKQSLSKAAGGQISFLSLRRPIKREILNMHPIQHWGANSPHDGPVSSIQAMPGITLDGPDQAMLLSGGMRDKQVFVQQLELSDGQVTNTLLTHKIQCNFTTRVSSMCYAHTRRYVVSGAENGRLCFNDVCSGKLVGAYGTKQRLAIGSLSVCPTDGNLIMAHCSSKDQQIQIFDMRQAHSNTRPVLVLGKSLERTQSRYSRPAWHPDGRLVFCPLQRSSNEGMVSKNIVCWDTRFVDCSREVAGTCDAHKSSVYSVAFAKIQSTGSSVMVTTATDYNIGFTTFRV